MQKQYKLYRIDENAIDDVKPLLNDYLYEKINQYIITFCKKWYNYDEGIDISHMTFGMKMDGRNCRFYCYNNGILAIHTEKIIIPVFELLRGIL